MNIKEKYRVVPITREYFKEWLLHKHYAKVIPNVMKAYGLVDNENILQGVCCYGTPANNHNNAMGDFKQIELVRLVVNDGLEKNTLSYLVSQSLGMLSRPLSLISYADQGKNHHGYIYQATNWIYTGLGGGVDYYRDKTGKNIHSRIMSDHRLKRPSETRAQIAESLGWEKIKGEYKHRYFYFLGSPKEKRVWLKTLLAKYKQLPYPKGDNQRYDASYKIETKII